MIAENENVKRNGVNNATESTVFSLNIKKSDVMAMTKKQCTKKKQCTSQISNKLVPHHFLSITDCSRELRLQK